MATAPDQAHFQEKKARLIKFASEKKLAFVFEDFLDAKDTMLDMFSQARHVYSVVDDDDVVIVC
jgi:hypothetical protein